MRNFFERLPFSDPSAEQQKKPGLAPAERESVAMRADIRRREQALNVHALNIDMPGNTDAMKATYQKTLERVRREARGEKEPDTGKIGATDAMELRAKAAVAADLFPLLAAYHAARAAQIDVEHGADVSEDLAEARAFLKQAEDTPKTSPANFLPDAILLGVQTRLVKKRPLPEPKKIAAAAGTDKLLLAEYALVLEEKDRGAFLDFVPGDRRREVSAILDTSVAPLLHQSLVEKKTPEEAQRMQVRRRLLAELKQTVEAKNPDDRHLVGLMAEAIGSLGEDTRQLLLEIIRDEYDREDAATDKQLKNEGQKKRKTTFPAFSKFSSTTSTTGAGMTLCFAWRATSGWTRTWPSIF